MDVPVYVVAGAGLVVPLGTGVVVMEAARSADEVARLRRVLAGLDGVQFTTAAASLSADLGPLAAVSVSESSWSILAPSHMHVHTVYRGRESRRDGPLHVVQHDPLTISLLPSQGAAPSEAPPALGEEPMNGGGIIVVAQVPAEAPTAIQVTGRRCVCGALLPPLSLRCWECGRELTAATLDLQVGDRPPLGFLVVDNGTSHPLDRGYVIGRDATTSPDVVADRARALNLRDVGRALSRVHTTVALQDWDVVITDESANGTFVRPTDGWRWERLVAGVPRRLLPGSDIRVGNHLLRYAPPVVDSDLPTAAGP